MNCHETERLLSAHIDGELETSDSDAVRQHLQSCPSCTSMLDDLQIVDQKLSVLNPPADLLAKIQSSVQREVGDSTSQVTPSGGGLPNESSSRWHAWGMIVAIAAAILLVIFVAPHDPVTVAPPVAGEIVRATGEVQLLVSGSQFWKPVSTDQRFPVPEGARVRTVGKVMCEMETSQQGRIRMNEDSELVFHQSDRVELVQGQLWCLAPDDGPLQIETPAVAPEPSSGSPGRDRWSMNCPRSSEFQWTASPLQTVCTSLAKQPAQWQIGSRVLPVEPGESVAVDTDRNVQRSPVIAAATKIWQLPLLAIAESGDGSGPGELSEVLQPLLVQIGHTKAQHLHERQIRALGPAGAIPLLAYVLSDESRSQAELRHTAMNLAIGTADRSATNLFETLASDEDSYVARSAVAALERLSRNDSQ